MKVISSLVVMSMVVDAHTARRVRDLSGCTLRTVRSSVVISRPSPESTMSEMFLARCVESRSQRTALRYVDEPLEQIDLESCCNTTEGARRELGLRNNIVRRELQFMLAIQRLPGLLPPSLGVHYSLLPCVITPSLAMIGWLVSLPAAASLVTFVCAQDLINTAIKWAVQRPRPLWHSPNSGLASKAGHMTSWEADFSFPSAHTQFFSGLAFCSWGLSGREVPVGLTLLFGAVIGITRNYLGVHWPSDTIFGLVLGSVLGLLWGRLDPYSRLLEAGSALLSIGVATGLTGGLLMLLLLVRQSVAPVNAETRDRWYANALSSAPETDHALCPEQIIRPRRIGSKIPMLTTVWCALAITALCPAHLPSAMNEPIGCVGCRFLQAVVGMGGLGGFTMILKRVTQWLSPPNFIVQAKGFVLPGRAKILLKGLAYAGICSWTFLLSQLARHRLVELMLGAAP